MSVVEFKKTGNPSLAEMAAHVENILPAIESAAEESEQLNRLSDATYMLLRDAGLFSMMMPKEVGGAELSHVDAMRLGERVAWAHGSAGWCVIVNNAVGGVMSLFVSEKGAADIFAEGPDVMVAGNGVPRGYARPVDGGYMIRGNWAYGSGIHHAAWIHSGCFVTEADGKTMVKQANGQPEIVITHHPRETIELKGNWDVLGLRATGSFDYTLKDADELFVPKHLCYGFNDGDAKRGGPQGSLGLVGYTAWGHTTWALGVGRRMLDELAKLAKVRVDAFGKMNESATFKYEFARAEARFRSARAFAYQAWASMAETFDAGRNASVEQVADVKLAMRHVHDVISDVGTFAHRAARGASLHNGTMQRFYRDIHSGTQHILMADEIVQECGRVYLGAVKADAKWGVFGVDG
ncbi:acyl-CoA dehydrogenase family protein [Aminobacter ciceronei]|jgi:alkylation response protein AidB-like acyl-CoA dehydrogenase|uniref:Alkylation response protein AidB-like acyl-CoA dehydrogenase n=1 Tax=Aminobacter ciceronei TaxID=150723 RepID=A0ABR6CCZ1_9HYPH|nr:acyl-CoA dehydrogenase family protein [Aminobacter ciceronei]MBA8909125.1 alkylation response protein AidB-like acyl-CoA dehydrogenase [Aminobacter ciceronei]MBA9022897.1 alkylation response protein AidB-like acyl-CoA dehydrogenase [Aminobacter ciceronei]WMC98320.1 acyl-CoA dehydrogenase family protein [Aminobacter aminovorans]